MTGPVVQNGVLTRSARSGAQPLAPIDLAFARLVARGLPDTLAPLLYQTALLVSSERAQGNSCVALRDYAGQPSPDVASAFVFPTASTWETALLASGRCTAAVPVGGITSDTSDTSGRHADQMLVLDGDRVYLRRYFVAEQRLAMSIATRLAHRQSWAAHETAPLFRVLFPAACSSTEIDWQALAATAALRSSLVFVTGGPGTGKTTVAAKLLALLLHQQPAQRIAIAAPTGRAAARLAEAIAQAAAREQLPPLVTDQLPTTGTTLHRLLGYRPWDECFAYGTERPLADDIIVVDEASMVDVLMMDALFAATRATARLIVLGDPDQLASVDTGFVLGDVVRAAQQQAHDSTEGLSPALLADYRLLCGTTVSTTPDHTVAMDRVPLCDAVVHLRHSYRFGQRSGIGALARATQQGDGAAVVQVLTQSAFTDVALRAPGQGMGSVLAPIESLIQAYLASPSPAEALSALARFRVLAALREGDDGVEGLNAAIERWLQRQGHDIAGWYHHRPVLITANDPGVQLFNGDVGATMVHEGVPMVFFPSADGAPRSITPSRLPAHETAWAMTVHKSQGSEFEHVVLVLPDNDSRVLTRELLYTGITRARQSVTVVGAPDLLQRATARSVSRNSGLVQRLTAPVI